jgi:O-antigen ligase
VLKYFEYTIVYFMAVNYLVSRKQMRTYFWAMLITCAVVSVLALAQIPGGGRVSAPFEGASGEPNTFGGYLVFMISITAGQFLTTPSNRKRMIFLALGVLFMIPFFYTQSRSSYLAIIPAFLCLLWLHEKRQWLIPVFLVLCIGFPFFAPKPAKERIAYTFKQGLHRKDVVRVGKVKLDTSLSSRLVSWKRASRDWVKHPIIGYGVTGYRFVDAQYVRVVTETGLLGLVAFLLLVYTIFRQAHRVFKGAKKPFERGLSLGYLAGFVGLLVHSVGANTFIIVRIMEPFWFTTAMIIMIPKLEKEEDVPPSE